MNNYTKNHKLIQAFCLLLVLNFTTIFCMGTPSYAATYEGELSLKRVKIKNITLDVVRVKYEFATLFQEPLKKFHLMWESSNPDLELSDIKFRAKVDTSAQNNLYIFFEPGHIPKQGEWSHDVPGSPEWNKMFSTKDGRFVDEQTAKSVFKSGLTLSELTIVDIRAGKNGGNGSAGKDKHTALHKKSAPLLRKIHLSKDKSRTELDDLLKDINKKAGNTHLPAWKSVLSTRISSIVKFAESVTSPQVAYQSYDLGGYSYIFFKIGPLFPYYCKNGGSITSPVNLDIDMNLKTASGQTIHQQKSYKTTTQILPGQVIVFGDRIKRDQKSNNSRMAASLVVTPKATKTCSEKSSAKNPFEMQEAQEKQDKIAKLKKEAKDLGAVNTTADNVVLRVWDHGTEDGDRIRIVVNGKVTMNNLYLENEAATIHLQLQEGLNILEIISLDTGYQGANTATFTLDQDKKRLEEKKWELEEGEKGVITIFFEPK